MSPTKTNTKMPIVHGLSNIDLLAVALNVNGTGNGSSLRSLASARILSLVDLSVMDGLVH